MGIIQGVVITDIESAHCEVKVSGQKPLRLFALFWFAGIRKSRGNVMSDFSTLPNIYLYKVAWACPTL